MLTALEKPVARPAARQALPAHEALALSERLRELAGDWLYQTGNAETQRRLLAQHGLVVH